MLDALYIQHIGGVIPQWEVGSMLDIRPGMCVCVCLCVCVCVCVCVCNKHGKRESIEI